jgi:uncharacterized repeat protein (TIGR03803 family)
MKISRIFTSSVHNRRKCVADLAILFIAAVLATGAARAQYASETVFYSFSKLRDGASPQSTLVLDSQGNLYGTTQQGGKSCSCGTVFKVDTSGNETVLYRFGTFRDGSGLPSAGLVRDALGNLYGTTYLGGKLGFGSVFKLDTSGKQTVLHSFTGVGGDGAEPLAGLVRDKLGNLYGTTYIGGNLACLPPTGCGTVFKVDTSGNETVLYSFNGAGVNDGAEPLAGLVEDERGTLYGTTQTGGNPECNCGTVFKVDASGKETVLYRFNNSTGADPRAPLLRHDGNLYGTTFSGGAYGEGTAFRVDATGKERVLYSFVGTYGGATDGANPMAGLVRDDQGNFYGTTQDGGGPSPGKSGYGTVFKLTLLPETTTTLTSSPNPSTDGEAVTFTAVVTPAPPDGETLTLWDDSESPPSSIDTGTLNGGVATFLPYPYLPVGRTKVTAVYSGDANLSPSTSKVLTQVVKK